MRKIKPDPQRYRTYGHYSQARWGYSPFLGFYELVGGLSLLAFKLVIVPAAAYATLHIDHWWPETLNTVARALISIGKLIWFSVI